MVVLTHKPPSPTQHTFGHPLRGLRSLDPGIRFHNHSTFGAVPQSLTLVDNATAGANAVLRSRAEEHIVIAGSAQVLASFSLHHYCISPRSQLIWAAPSDPIHQKSIQSASSR